MGTVDFSELEGKTLVSIVRADPERYNSSEKLVFETTGGETYELYHTQDCCENVSIEDVCGDLDDLVGSPLLLAEETSNEDEKKDDRWADNYLTKWTFYKLATVKGAVTIRWYGHSNGYYGVSVNLHKKD